eukprot:11516147-Alexandrium_andersonii.AAC.1
MPQQATQAATHQRTEHEQRAPPTRPPTTHATHTDHSVQPRAQTGNVAQPTPQEGGQLPAGRPGAHPPIGFAAQALLAPGERLAAGRTPKRPTPGRCRPQAGGLPGRPRWPLGWPFGAD